MHECMNAAGTQLDYALFRKVVTTLNEAQRRWLVRREALRMGGVASSEWWNLHYAHPYDLTPTRVSLAARRVAVGC
jgi:hypothetical protein